MTKLTKPSDTLFQDLRALIVEARQDVARQVNSVLVLLYWRAGKRIRQDILKEKRAEYGEQIIATLSQQLVAEFGAGFTARNLANMVRFVDVFQDEKILHTLCAKVSWSHFRLIIYLDDDLKRDFYAEICRIEQWSTRTLEKEKRAEYGEEIVATLSTQLVPEFGEGFSKRNLFRMIHFAKVFPEEQNCRDTVTTIGVESLC
jgi:hypothetical protein